MRRRAVSSGGCLPLRIALTTSRPAVIGTWLFPRRSTTTCSIAGAFATASSAPAADAEGPEGMLSLREQLDAVERSLIQRTMTASGGNQSEAARRLGLNRGSLIERLKKYGMIAS